MAITVTKQNVVNGETVGVVKLHLVSGAASDVTDQSLLDVSTLNGTPSLIKIMEIKCTSSDMDIDLIWDGDTDKDIMTLPAGDTDFNFRRFGGLINNAEAPTGDILFSTRGAAADSEATIIIQYRTS